LLLIIKIRKLGNHQNNENMETIHVQYNANTPKKKTWKNLNGKQ